MNAESLSLLRRRWLLWRAVWRLAVASAGLRVLGFRRMQQLTGTPEAREGVGARAGGGSERKYSAGALASALERGSRLVPGSTCLVQALAGEWLLRGEGYTPQLRIGVSKSEGFAAHAWIELEGKVLIGEAEASRFTPFPPLVVFFAVGLALFFSVASFRAQATPAQNPLARAPASPVRVFMQTQFGVLLIEVDAARAPVTAANFLRYVDAGAYNGGQFHRTVRLNNQPNKKVKIEVIQAGPNPAHKDFPPIPLERTKKTGLAHKDGTVSMARDAPDTATADFFICIGDQPSLDFGGARNRDGQGFAAFGRVVKGMDVVRRIHAAPVDAQRLAPPIAILSAKRLQ